MIRLIGFDLDGTLLAPDKRITRKTRGVLERCAQRKIVLVPVTGRPFSGIPEEIRRMEFIHYAVSSNGSVTSRVPDGKVMRSFMMSAQTVQRVLLCARRAAGGRRFIAEVFTGGAGYHDGQTELLMKEKYRDKPALLAYFKASRKTVPDLQHFVSGGTFENISLMFSDGGQRQAAEGLLFDIPDIRVIVPASTDLEIVCGEADKGKALAGLAQDLGVRRDEVMAIGDGPNDRELLSCAGISVAMGNADGSLKDMADYVAQDNRHDGAAEAIERLVLCDR